MKNHNHVTIRNDDSYNDNNNGHLVLSESDSSCSSLFKSNDWYSVGKILAIDALGLRALTVGRSVTVQLVSSSSGLDSAVSVHANIQYIQIVESNPVKQETYCTVSDPFCYSECPLRFLL